MADGDVGVPVDEEVVVLFQGHVHVRLAHQLGYPLPLSDDQLDLGVVMNYYFHLP